jgi:hypothetical protein
MRIGGRSLPIIVADRPNAARVILKLCWLEVTRMGERVARLGYTVTDAAAFGGSGGAPAAIDAHHGVPARTGQSPCLRVRAREDVHWACRNAAAISPFRSPLVVHALIAASRTAVPVQRRALGTGGNLIVCRANRRATFRRRLLTASARSLQRYGGRARPRLLPRGMVLDLTLPARRQICADSDSMLIDTRFWQGLAVTVYPPARPS